MYIEASGEGVVTAGDIKADSEVEILNPEHPIATLGPEAVLNMELTLSHGRGYVPAERNKTPQTVIGVIPVDSVYTPVKKVNYTVENTRVKDLTDFDKLTLEVYAALDCPRSAQLCVPGRPPSSATTLCSLQISARPWATSPRWWRNLPTSATRCWR